MTLQISVFVRNQTTGRSVSIELEDGKEKFGFYSDISRLWGSDVMRELGLVIMPELKIYGSIFVEKEQLDLLEKDMLIAQENLELIYPKIILDPEYFLMHTQNVLDAITIAREQNGVIYIG